MKRIISLVFIGLIICSCVNKTDNFNKYQWILHYVTYDEIYNQITNERVMFRNDSAISYSEILSKEIAFPLTKTDSTISFKKQATIFNDDYERSNKRDTILIDTMIYDYKKILNLPVLVTKSLKLNEITVLACSDENANIKETNNFLNMVSFKIGGYNIGDSINLDLLTDIDEDWDINGETVTMGRLKQNENITLYVIDNKYIYSIKQEQIESDAVENIINVINKKLNMYPDTIKPPPDFKTEGFKWFTDGIEIELSKLNFADAYFEAAKKTKDYIMSRVLLNRATKELEKIDKFTLEYNNYVLQQVLKFKRNKIPASTIIE